MTTFSSTKGFFAKVDGFEVFKDSITVFGNTFRFQ